MVYHQAVRIHPNTPRTAQSDRPSQYRTQSFPQQTGPDVCARADHMVRNRPQHHSRHPWHTPLRSLRRKCICPRFSTRHLYLPRGSRAQYTTHRSSQFLKIWGGPVILFFENGRLGNQLFQYCGFKKYFPDDRLILFGFDDIHNYFDHVEAHCIPKSKMPRWMGFRRLKRIARFLAEIRILGLLTEDPNPEHFNITSRKGLLWMVFVSRDAYFQHRDVVNNLEYAPNLKPDLRERATRWLHARDIRIDRDLIVFIHVRRGDYLHWPSKDYPAVMDLAWYRRAMGMIKDKVRNPVFILMSDDQNYLHDVFEESETLFISNNTAELDLAIMAECKGGILSASSFAWWGAFYAQPTRKRDAYFIAPKYWCGYRAKEWYPAGFRTDWITYIE